MKKVAIGMSGGVDSSVAAAVLKEQGYEVIGVTMRLWDGEKSVTEDARRVAEYLGIEYHELDLREEFSKYVMDYFTEEYLNGRTPNPCIACNRFLKFDAMWKHSKKLGADMIATGHYARIEKDQNSGRFVLRRAKADAKDQTYVLYSLTQEQLSHTLMPLGAFENKDEVRKKAEELKIPTANKPESMEICFIPDQDYAGFIHRRTGKNSPEGDFVDLDGNILGRHNGIMNYTVGQRKGLGIAFGKPMFVVRIDALNNQVVLGESGSEFSDSLIANDWNFIPFSEIKEPYRVEAKVRYSAKPAPATIYNMGEEIKVEFDTPQRAITPGQAVVFYEIGGDMVIGGATIIR